MALIKQFFADWRGKLAGTIFSSNRGGAYTREKVTPTNPQSERQQAARARLAQLAQAYSYTLTQVQRESWIHLANTQTYKNVFGDSKHLTAMAMFVKVNALLLEVGLPYLATAPNNLAVVPMLVSVTTIPTTATRSWSLELTPALTATERVMAYSTAGVRPSIQFVKNLYRFAYYEPGPAGSVDVDLDGQGYLGPIAVGDQIHTLVARLNTTTGGMTIGVPITATIIA
jgi:hypothetical protein